jgi:hypothetical protein
MIDSEEPEIPFRQRVVDAIRVYGLALGRFGNGLVVLVLLAPL